MTTDQILQQIGQRSSEITVWIFAKNLVWVALFITAVWLCYRAIRSADYRVWILVGFLSIAWLSFETAAGYYLHENGANAYQLEKQLPNDVGHEHWRETNRSTATKAAPIGFALPFVLLLGGACYTLASQYKGEHGIAWAITLGAGFIVVFIYYALVVSGAKPSG